MSSSNSISSIEVINFNCYASNKQLYLRVRRYIELLIVSILLLFLSPLLLVVSVLIKFSSKGSILYTQDRIGLDRKVFKIYKFRSMAAMEQITSVDAHYHDGLSFKLSGTCDPRITTIGKFIRKYSIDELPQLLNVIKGDMSLIGPRPTMLELYDDSTQIYLRTVVRPGMTGLWQVRNRANPQVSNQLKYDSLYIENLTWKLDLYIIYKTIAIVFLGRGC